MLAARTAEGNDQLGFAFVLIAGDHELQKISQFFHEHLGFIPLQDITRHFFIESGKWF